MVIILYEKYNILLIKQVKLPDQCKIIHTETLQRHGSRHVNKLKKLESIEDRFEILSILIKKR